jgi:glucosylceramidase
MTLGNEPGHTADYPTMAISDAALARLASLVGPRLDDLGVELWGLDHNWADVPRVAATGTVGLDAVALHCYEGAPADASQLSVPWLVTECTGTDDTASGTFAWDSRNLVSGAVAAGSTGLIMWNLALPPGYQGVFGGCTTCRGLLTVPAPGAGDVVREPEFFTLAHLRRAAPPGASVVPTSTTGPLLTAGFLAADQVGVYGYNDSDVRRTVRIRTVDGSLSSVHEVGPHEMFSWVAHLS